MKVWDESEVVEAILFRYPEADMAAVRNVRVDPAPMHIIPAITIGRLSSHRHIRNVTRFEPPAPTEYIAAYAKIPMLLKYLFTSRPQNNIRHES